MRTPAWLAVAVFLSACAATPSADPKAPKSAATDIATPPPCTPGWYAHVDRAVGVSDAQGHGPDFGSDEWRFAVEHHLGVRDDPDFPEPRSDAWCRAVDARVEHSP